MLIAHPDDEVIFGWPVLARAKRIICCSTDQGNPARPFGTRRRDALMHIGAMVGAEVFYFDHPSEFYRANARDGSLERLAAPVLALLQQFPGPLYTHNPWGEYGHLDHVLVHQIARCSGRPLLVSDMATHANWLPVHPYLVGDFVFAADLDPAFYARCKSVYDAQGAWTWSQDPIRSARVFRCQGLLS